MRGLPNRDPVMGLRFPACVLTALIVACRNTALAVATHLMIPRLGFSPRTVGSVKVRSYPVAA